MYDVLKDLEVQIGIIRQVFEPIIGKPFVHCPLIVFLQAEEIRMLIEVVARFRPAHRRHRSVKANATYAFLLPDYCCVPQSLKLAPSQGPVLCIEIKPKQGFMKEDYFPGSSSSLPIPMCRCCMMKWYMLKKGAISVKSEYCPTDLFSGCHTRMHHALKMLCKTPQNNFRIFKNQKLVFSEENKDKVDDVVSDFFVLPGQINSTDLLCDLILRALLRPLSDGIHKSPVSLQRRGSRDCVNAHSVCAENDPCHELPLNCVLERILNCQSLDNLTISELYQLYQQVKVKSQDKCSNHIGCCSRSEIPPHIGELGRNSSETEFKYASRKVWEFLMALTVKDCSIMLILKRLINSSTELQTQNIIPDKYGNLYLFSIAIADLDAKTLDKVEKVYSTMCLIRELFEV